MTNLDPSSFLECPVRVTDVRITDIKDLATCAVAAQVECMGFCAGGEGVPREDFEEVLLWFDDIQDDLPTTEAVAKGLAGLVRTYVACPFTGEAEAGR
jgi:hypothetical protein